MQEKYLIVYEDGCFCESEVMDFTAFQQKEKVFVHFLFKTEGYKAYSDIELYDVDGELIDSCFVSYKWENVNAETSSYEENGRRFVVLKVQNDSEEKYALKTVAFNQPMGNLFDGGVLYQIAPQKAQIMGYVYVTKTGQVLAFDGGMDGDKAALLRIIQKYGGVVHHWFITHYHNDHIGAIIELFKDSSVKVEKLYFDFPSPELLVDRGDGDNPLVEKWLSLIPQETQVITPKQGDVYALNAATVTVLNNAAFDILHDFSNNSSVVYKLDTGKTKVLFTGDLERKGDEYLGNPWFVEQLSDCTVVQMSHHGQKGVSKKFYDATAVEVCLYPTPLWLWNNDRGGGKNSSFWTTLYTREWMRERNVKKSYTSIQNKTVEIY